MKFYICPKCYSISDIEIDQHEEQEEYLLRFNGIQKCSSCGHEINFNGTADIHEGQSNRDYDTFLMDCNYDCYDEDRFVELDSPELNQLTLNWQPFSESYFEYEQVITDTKSRYVTEGIKRHKLLSYLACFFEFDQLMQCGTCKKIFSLTFSRTIDNSIKIGCPKCQAQEKPSYSEVEDKISISLELKLFGLLGNTRDELYSDLVNLTCNVCGSDDVINFVFEQASFQTHTNITKAVQCTNCCQYQFN